MYPSPCVDLVGGGGVGGWGGAREHETRDHIYVYMHDYIILYMITCHLILQSSEYDYMLQHKPPGGIISARTRTR